MNKEYLPFEFSLLPVIVCYHLEISDILEWFISCYCFIGLYYGGRKVRISTNSATFVLMSISLVYPLEAHFHQLVTTTGLVNVHI